MEFQVYTVCLEDRLPRGLPGTIHTRDALLEDVDDDELQDPNFGTVVEKSLPGAVALVFGRDAQGRSVCARVEGVRPRLFFELKPDETVAQVQRELENEIKLRSGDDIEVVEREFCHFYGFEPDPTSPSGRQVHRYVEASYPSLAAWRAAVQLRRDHELPRLERLLDAMKAQEAEESGAGEWKSPRIGRMENRIRKLRDAYATALREWEAESRGAATTTTTGATVDAAPTPPGRKRPRPTGPAVIESDQDLCRPAHEWFVDPLTRFLQEQDLTPSKWYRVPSRIADVSVTTCDVEVCVPPREGFVHVPERVLDAPHVTAYYDIETLGLDPEQEPVIQVGLVFVCNGKQEKHLVALKSVAPLPDIRIHACANETDVLRKTRELLIRKDPDFVVAYNGVNFDNRYLARRAEKLEVGVFWHCSRYALRKSSLRELQLNSSGMGDNLLRYLDMPGRTNFDWYIKLKRDLTSEPTYKLNHFAKTLCGDQKEELASGLRWKRAREPPEHGGVDLSASHPELARALRGGKLQFTQAEWETLGPLDLHAKHYVAETNGKGREQEAAAAAAAACFRPVNVDYRAIAPLQAGTPHDRARLGSYCVQDASLLDSLDKARTMITEILQFCGVFHVVPEWIYFRGQQVRFIAQLLRKSRVVEAVPLLLQKPPEGWSGEGVEGFEGATVNEPKRGFYKIPVATLDWKSLYPSIMISFNLCHSTYVKDPRYFKLEGVVEHVIRAFGLKWRARSTNSSNKPGTPIARERVHEAFAASLLSGKLEFTKCEWDEFGMGDPRELRTTPGGDYVVVDDKHHFEPVECPDPFVTYFATQHKGVLPLILEELLEERSKAKKEVKKHLKAAKDPECSDEERARHAQLAKVWDGRQLALKVACNSVYGACGAVETGKYPCLAVSATTTYQGREAMVIKKRILPAKFPGVDVIYGDTDSVMVTFANVTDVQECGTIAAAAADYVTDYFVEVLKLAKMELEFEKIFFPYLLENKKRYIGKKYEPDANNVMHAKGIDAKGVETERKDTLPFTKEIMYAVRDALMEKVDDKLALQRFRDKMDELVRDKVPMEKLILRKNLSSKVANKTSQIAHARVNALKREREAGSESAVNEQVEYVIVQSRNKWQKKTTELAEDPAYAKEHGLKLNRLWYFEHCIVEALGKVFAACDDINFEAVCREYKGKLESARLGADSNLMLSLLKAPKKNAGSSSS